MALGMPASFANSFHSSPSPRRGLERLDSKLNAGLQDSAQIIRLFRARANVHRQSSLDLLAALPTEADVYPDPGDDGGSLIRALTALRGETEAQAHAHRIVATEIERSIIAPFEEWSVGHDERVKDGQNQIYGFIRDWEGAASQLDKARNSYNAKAQLVDEADSEARLTDIPSIKKPLPAIDTSIAASKAAKSPRALMSAVSETDDNHATASTSNGSAEPMRSVGDNSPATMIKSVSANGHRASIADRLRALTTNETGSHINLPADKVIPDEKGKAKETDPILPKMIEIAGVTNGAREWSHFFEEAKEALPKRSLKLPLVGTYHDVHSGAELVRYFQESLVALEGSYERSFEFCRQLVEELHILRLLGQFGRRFYDSDDAMFAWDKEAFALHRLHETPKESEARPSGLEPSPTSANSPPHSADGPKSEGLKRSSTVSYISSAYKQASLYAKEATAVANERLSETRQQYLHREQESSERAYREAVERAETARLVMDQAIGAHLPYMQRCEAERLKAASRAMSAFTAACGPIVRRLQTAAEEAATAVNGIKPEQDMTAIMEIYRTGPYRPVPHVFLSHDGVQEGNFGIDLHRWEETQAFRPQETDAHLPLVFSQLLDHLVGAYAVLTSDHERRMIWIYEVPLPVVHRLRNRLNDTRIVSPMSAVLEKADPPVCAALVKLWLLELDPPIVPYVLYEELRGLYAHHIEGSADDDQLHALKLVLEKMPRLHLVVLDALITHLQSLISMTRQEGHDETYRNKLALILGRCIARPKIDTALSLNDKAPTRFFAELLAERDKVLPVVIASRAQRESHRFDKPVRKRTAPIDMRPSRKSLGMSSDDTMDPKEVQDVLKRQLSPPPVAPTNISGANSTPPRQIASLEPASLAPPTLSPLASSTRSPTPEFVDAPSGLPPLGPVSPPTLRNGTDGDDRPILDAPFVPPRHQSFDEESDPPFVPPDEEEPLYEASSPELSYSTPLRQSLDNERDRPFVPPSSSKSRLDNIRRSYEERDPPFIPPTARDDEPISANPSNLTRDGAGSLQRSVRVSRGVRSPPGSRAR